MIVSVAIAMLCGVVHAQTAPSMDASASGLEESTIAPSAEFQPDGAPPDIAGRYVRKVTRRNLEENVDVEHEDFLAIKALAGNAISFEYQSWHTNGHACGLEGKANQIGAGVYESEPIDTLPGERPCTARIHVEEKNISIEDVDDSCRNYHCGMRGMISVDSFARSLRQ